VVAMESAKTAVNACKREITHTTSLNFYYTANNLPRHKADQNKLMTVLETNRSNTHQYWLSHKADFRDKRLI
jgi:hypothetical protein